MLLKLRTYFSPKTIHDEEAFHQTGLLIFAMLTVILASLILCLVSVVMHLSRGTFIMGSLFILSTVLLFLFRRSAIKYEISAHLFLLFVTIAIVLCVYFDGGIYSAILPWFSLVAVGGIILFSKAEAILWACVLSCIVLLFSFINYNDLAMSKDVPKSVYPIFISSCTLCLIFAFFYLVQYFEQTLLKSMAEIRSQKRVIEREQKRSDELLLNILPEAIMHELKATGKTPAHRFEQVSVIFADFKDFSKISATLTPEVLVEALEAYFEAFDKVIKGFDIEKIKTVGDAYICASGIPVANQTNAFVAVEVAQKFLDVIAEYNIERKDKVHFDIRIGIHTGPVVAGVVGFTKFAYDIWGDTVNTAARMQENGDTNKINVSQTTYDIIKEKYHCVYRGKIAAKNKGEIDMYFIS